MNLTWSGGPPSTIPDLFKFYHEYVKLLYSYVQTQNALPQETLFEINAAFDHISRMWTMGESEATVCQKAYGHLKRSCLDIFKIKLKETRRQYDELAAVDTSMIDNGDYDRNLHILFNKIRNDATEARQVEGKTDEDDSVPAFDKWQSVFVLCIDFEQTFFLHPRLNWARRKRLLATAKNIFTGVTIPVVAYTLKLRFSEPDKVTTILVVATVFMTLVSLGWQICDLGYHKKVFPRLWR